MEANRLPQKEATVLPNWKRGKIISSWTSVDLFSVKNTQHKNKDAATLQYVIGIMSFTGITVSLNSNPQISPVLKSVVTEAMPNSQKLNKWQPINSTNKLEPVHTVEK